MREIILNGVHRPIHSDVIQHRINPWKAKLGGASLEYADFSSAELEEYFDFRNGIGKKRGVGSDARLDWSEGIDFANEGQAVLGPLVNTTTAATPPSTPTIANADMELDSDWTGGARDSGQAHGGTYSWKVTGAAGTQTYQDISWDANYRKRNVTFTGWVYDTSATNSRVFIDDGVTATTYSSYHAGNSAWAQLSVTLQLASNATRLRIGMQIQGGAAYLDDVTITIEGTGTTFTAVKIIDFENKTYAITNIGIYQWNTGTSVWDFVDFLASPIDAIVVTDSTDTYLVVSSATAAVYTTDGATWSTLTGCQGYLAWYDTKLRGIDTDGITVRSSAANNIDGSWTTFSLTGYFGTVYRLFEGKLLSDGTPTLYFCGTEGLYSIDTTNNVAYKQEVSYPPITNAGNVGIYWNANVWVATGYGILKVAPSVATFVGPDQDDGLPSGSQGKVYDFATVNNWLVFCVNGGTTDESSILKRNSTLGGNLQVYTTSAANKAIACLHHSPSSLYTNGRLWFGEGTDVKYMMFPDTTSNVKQIATYDYVNDSGYGNLPIFRKLAVIPKTALGMAAITKSCSTTDYVEVFYGLNGAAATTSLGTFKTSPKPTTLTFGSGLGTAFYTIQFAIKLFQGATVTNSPELESLMFYWLPVPTTILGWTFQIMCTDEDSAETIKALEAIRDTQTLVAFYPSGDENKTSYNVKLTRLGERIMYEEQGAAEGYLEVVLEEIFSG